MIKKTHKKQLMVINEKYSHERVKGSVAKKVMNNVLVSVFCGKRQYLVKSHKADVKKAKLKRLFIIGRICPSVKRQ